MRHEQGLDDLEFRAWCAVTNREPTMANYGLWLRLIDDPGFIQR